MQRTLARGLVAVVVMAALSLLVRAAEAKAHHDSPYTFEQTFGSTLRLLKVDLELQVTEANPEWGYLLFEYTSTESGKRKNRGSFTFIKDESHHRVQVRLQIPEMPSYHEQLVLEKLKRKLESEHGEPPRQEPEERPKRDDDEDEDDGDEPPKDAGNDDAPKKTPHAKPRRPARSARRRS
ncbi:MAG: hypothetical protein R3B72_37090 [Polyangiaceae bacterium]